MFKGIDMNLRDAKWHKKHTDALKRRAAIARDHLRTGYHLQVIDSRQMAKAEAQYQKAMAQETGRKIGWLTRLWAYIQRLFGKSNWQFHPAS